MAEAKELAVGNVVTVESSPQPRVPEKKLNSSPRDYAGAQAKSDLNEIRLVRKLDYRVMPVLWMMYFWNYVDRGALAQARLNNLERDLGMVGDNFNTAVSILTVGSYLSGFALVWAIISTCTGLVKSYGSLLACRFLLGFFEAPFYPGALYLLSILYTRKEVASRIAILYTAQMAGLSFANLIAAGVFQGLDGVQGLAGWRWLLYLEGTASGITAIVAYFFIPDTEHRSRWLTEDEYELIRFRMERDRLVDAHEHESVWEALKNASKDKRTWLFCLMQNFHYGGLSFVNFLPTVIQTLKFGNTVSLLLACPPYILAGIASLLLAWSSGRFHERTWHITAGFSVAVIGFVTAASTLNSAGRYVACFIFPMGAYSVNAVIVGWAATTLSQSHERKAVILAMVNVSAQIAQIYGAYLWPSSNGPRYVIGFATSAVFSLLALIMAWVIRFMLKRENDRVMRERDAAVGEINTYGY